VTTASPQLPGLTDLSPLGRGGFADVYLARQERLGRFVAVKVFRVTLSERSVGDQFLAECKALGRLDGHPNIVTVHDANVLPDGTPYILMEQCDSSLHRLLGSRGSLPAPDVAQLGTTIAHALLFAHRASVFHGDVTPQNILLRATGAPVLADFGLAVLRDYQGNVASGFTMAHAAPETVRYDGAIDDRTDVYGLGSTLYTALTGAPPFPPRPGEPDAARANRILTEPPARPQGPAWLADLLLAMLAKDPGDRPSLTAAVDVLSSGGANAPAAPPAPPVGASAPPPDAPVYLPPGTPAPDLSRGHTRQRPHAGPGTLPGTPADGEGTRIRPVPSDPAGPPAGGPNRSRVPLIAGAAALVLVVAGGLAFWLWPRGSSPIGPAPVASGVSIRLDQPVDRGTTVDLRWSASTTLDFNLVVGSGGQQAESTLVGRVTEYTAEVEAGRPYCFRVQGSTPTGEVAESNVVSIRGAVCRFADP
jgi:hypothetical protein